MAENKNRIFNFFTSSRNKTGKGITKEQAQFDGKYNLKNFFSFLKFRFGDITIANLIFVLLNFSLLLMLYAISGNLNDTAATPSSTLYPQLYGILQYDNASAFSIASESVYGLTMTISVWTAASKALLYTGFSLLITFGFSNIGMAYLTRGFVRRDYLYIWHDFWTSIKKNWKQGLIVGLIDVVVCFLLYNALMFYGANRVTFYMQVSFYLVIAFLFIYFIMRMYFYLMIVTFDLKISKIIKNALIFTLLGIKRNLCAVLGMFLVIFLNIYLYMLLPSVGVLLPFVFTIGLLYFIGAYCVFPVISKYMIDPYYNTEKPEQTEKPVFTDRG